MRHYLLLSIIALTFSACAVSKQPITQEVIRIERPKPYQFNHTPIIGTQNPDEKIVVDMGVVLRVWINSYKDRNGDLVASHDIYIWAKKPDFIVQTKEPGYTQRGLKTPQGLMPFLPTNQEVDRSDFSSNEAIRSYVNALYEKSVKPQALKQRLQSGKKFDQAIKQFLKERE